MTEFWCYEASITLHESRVNCCCQQENVVKWNGFNYINVSRNGYYLPILVSTSFE